MYNQGECKSDMPHSNIQEIHKPNENITNKGIRRLAEHVPTQIRIV